MIKILLSLFVLLSLNLNSQERNLTARDCAIMIDAQVTMGLQTTVTLNWNRNEQAKQYIIYKKELGGSFTGSPIAQLDSITYSWTDSQVEEGKIYEYKIIGNSIGRINNGGNPLDVQYLASGYKAVSVNATPYKGGRLLILVDSTMKDELSMYIDRFIEDISREGWTYILHYVPRAEDFDGIKVRQVKSLILEEWNKKEFDNIFLVGRVPVPYSGDIVPDGHTNNHRGAWPADMYYGSMVEGYWTDVSVNSTSAPARTQNIPGDGKFDISSLYNNQGQIVITTQAGVGRVDFYKMSLFEKSEVELLQAYFDKDHAFRTGMVEVENKALIDNNFAASSILGAFAWSGWANFASVIGKDNIVAGDWIKASREENLQDKTYIMAFGDGGGSYTSSSGVGTSANFAENNLNAVFSILFGSYFGDWDVDNNLMRSALASEPSILTCSWSGRPHWYYHHLGLDYPIGYSTKVTLNNTLDYVPMLIMNNGQLTFPEGLLLQVHTSLLGDPTLKVNAMPELTHLESFAAIQEGEDTKLTWEVPNDGKNHKYDIYYNVDMSDVWHKANEEYITGNEYLDDFKYDGEIKYLIREVISEGGENQENSVHGYLNKYSRGNLATILRSDVNSVENDGNQFSLNIGPNPTTDEITIKFKSNGGKTTIKVIDLESNLLKEFDYTTIKNSVNSVNWNLSTENGFLSNGVYFVVLENGNEVLTKKFVVNR